MDPGIKEKKCPTAGQTGRMHLGEPLPWDCGDTGHTGAAWAPTEMEAGSKALRLRACPCKRPVLTSRPGSARGRRERTGACPWGHSRGPLPAGRGSRPYRKERGACSQTAGRCTEKGVTGTSPGSPLAGDERWWRQVCLSAVNGGAGHAAQVGLQRFFRSFNRYVLSPSSVPVPVPSRTHTHT